MSKTKSITELVTDLQAENESLQSLKKFFNQAVKNEFGYDVKTLHEIITKQQIYERKVAERQAKQQGLQYAPERSE